MTRILNVTGCAYVHHDEQTDGAAVAIQFIWRPTARGRKGFAFAACAHHAAKASGPTCPIPSDMAARYESRTALREDPPAITAKSAGGTE